MNDRIISCVGMALVIFCLYPLENAEAQMFEPNVDYDVGGDPADVAIADLNGDSHLDLAVPNGSIPTVSVLLGNGDGTFQDAVDYGTGVQPGSISVDDLNGDGIPDLITGNAGVSFDDGGISVLLGNGDGSFQTCVDIWDGNAADTVTGDLDGDGDIDIAVSDYSSNLVAVLLGNGDGTFQLGEPLTFNNGCSSIAIGDLDQDSIPDLVVGIYNTGYVPVLLGNGDATFETAGGYNVGYAVDSIAIGDLNGDSIPDLTTAHMYENRVSVRLGNGDGTFQNAIDFEDQRLRPYSVAIGDLDGDGIPDLATSNNCTSWYYSSASVLLGNGDGTFLPTIHLEPAGGTASSVAIGDLNSDGSQDLAVTDLDAHTISVLINEREPGVTIFADLSCEPRNGQVPFETRMSVTLLNRIPDQSRQVAARIQVDLPNGQSIADWRAGYQHILGGARTTTSWVQTIPALHALIGSNLFTLVAEDVTAAPWNQPPYPASGYSAESNFRIWAASYTMESLTKNGYP